jgi:hypothetical protein
LSLESLCYAAVLLQKPAWWPLFDYLETVIAGGNFQQGGGYGNEGRMQGEQCLHCCNSASCGYLL